MDKRKGASIHFANKNTFRRMPGTICLQAYRRAMVIVYLQRSFKGKAQIRRAEKGLVNITGLKLTPHLRKLEQDRIITKTVCTEVPQQVE